jgi:hypothetical protein
MQEAIRRAFSKAAKVRLKEQEPFLESDNQVRLFRRLSRKIEGRLSSGLPEAGRRIKQISPKLTSSGNGTNG